MHATEAWTIIASNMNVARMMAMNDRKMKRRPWRGPREGDSVAFIVLELDLAYGYE